jgi:hypothetical protein
MGNATGPTIEKYGPRRLEKHHDTANCDHHIHTKAKRSSPADEDVIQKGSIVTCRSRMVQNVKNHRRYMTWTTTVGLICYLLLCQAFYMYRLCTGPKGFASELAAKSKNKTGLVTLTTTTTTMFTSNLRQASTGDDDSIQNEKTYKQPLLAAPIRVMFLEGGQDLTQQSGSSTPESILQRAPSLLLSSSNNNSKPLLNYHYDQEWLTGWGGPESAGHIVQSLPPDYGWSNQTIEEHEDQHCEPMAKWQTQPRQICNTFHETDLMGSLQQEGITKLGNGFWRLGYRLDGLTHHNHTDDASREKSPQSLLLKVLRSVLYTQM